MTTTSTVSKRLLAVVICVALLASTMADCPDADIQCRVSGSDIGVITIGQCYDLFQGEQFYSWILSRRRPCEMYFKLACNLRPTIVSYRFKLPSRNGLCNDVQRIVSKGLDASVSLAMQEDVSLNTAPVTAPASVATRKCQRATAGAQAKKSAAKVGVNSKHSYLQLLKAAVPM